MLNNYYIKTFCTFLSLASLIGCSSNTLDNKDVYKLDGKQIDHQVTRSGSQYNKTDSVVDKVHQRDQEMSRLNSAHDRRLDNLAKNMHAMHALEEKQEKGALLKKQVRDKHSTLAVNSQKALKPVKRINNK